jgi:hypothetical protein
MTAVTKTVSKTERAQLASVPVRTAQEGLLAPIPGGLLRVVLFSSFFLTGNGLALPAG